jgi:hypothetical protein
MKLITENEKLLIVTYYLNIWMNTMGVYLQMLAMKPNSHVPMENVSI